MGEIKLYYSFFEINTICKSLNYVASKNKCRLNENSSKHTKYYPCKIYLISLKNIGRYKMCPLAIFENKHNLIMIDNSIIVIINEEANMIRM